LFADGAAGFAEGLAIGGGASLRPLGRGFAGAVMILYLSDPVLKIMGDLRGMGVNVKIRS